MVSDAKGKGKAKAIAVDVRETEHTPLITSSPILYTTPLAASSYDVPADDAVRPGLRDAEHHQGRRQRSRLAQALSWLALFALVGLFSLLIFVAFVWATLRAAPASRLLPETVFSNATRWGTNSIQVVKVADGQVQLTVHADVGVDTEWVLGIDPDDDSAMAYARRATGRWLVSALGGLRAPASTTFTISAFDGTFLLNCTTGPQLAVPVLPNLAAFRKKRAIQMSPVTIPLTLAPSHNASDLVRVAQATWLHAGLRVKITTPELTLETARKPWWLPNVRRTMYNLDSNLALNLPHFPQGYPQPGSPLNLDEIVDVGSYELDIREDHGHQTIEFAALANLKLPLETSSSDRIIHFPPQLPVFPLIISLLGVADPSKTFPLAHITASPQFNYSGTFASISVPVRGTMLPISSEMIPSLSQLASDYLAARPNTVVVAPFHATPPSQEPSFPFSFPPTPISLPAPAKKPKILRGLTVRNMKLGASEDGEELTASGTLFASFGLPAELSGLTPRLDIRRVWPDALVYDGLPPPQLRSGSAEKASVEVMVGRRPAPPLPKPLPAGAFARIRPTDWLNATTLDTIEHQVEAEAEYVDVDQDGVLVRWVKAELDNAPLDVLPGRDKEFQAFVRKLLTARGKGVLAGVRGTAAIAFRIDGLSFPGGENGEGGDIELDGLGFEGSFIVGKTGSLDFIGHMLD
ncbi:hypothetical protein DL93DRAFT_1402404 [Clavulina sp. PMI_390]|nr:hypothetical protein DL93DRAFT_1402404 [Clavulina sp. PMI_390]